MGVLAFCASGGGGAFLTACAASGAIASIFPPTFTSAIDTSLRSTIGLKVLASFAAGALSVFSSGAGLAGGVALGAADRIGSVLEVGRGTDAAGSTAAGCAAVRTICAGKSLTKDEEGNESKDFELHLYYY